MAVKLGRFHLCPRGGAPHVQNMQLIVLQDKRSEFQLDAHYRENGFRGFLGCTSVKVPGVSEYRHTNKKNRPTGGYPAFRGWRTALLAEYVEARLEPGDATAQSLAAGLNPQTVPGIYNAAYHRVLLGHGAGIVCHKI